MFKSNQRRLGIGSIAVMLLLGVSCGPSQEPGRPGDVPAGTAGQQVIHARVIEVTAGQVPISVEVTGQVTAVYQATLASRIQGTIDNLLVR